MTLAEMADVAVFIASDKASGMTGGNGTLECDKSHEQLSRSAHP
jgi:hypothetical protein